MNVKKMKALYVDTRRGRPANTGVCQILCVNMPSRSKNTTRLKNNHKHPLQLLVPAFTGGTGVSAYKDSILRLKTYEEECVAQTRR
jgi:hypothetical protein